VTPVRFGGSGLDAAYRPQMPGRLAAIDAADRCAGKTIKLRPFDGLLMLPKAISYRLTGRVARWLASRHVPNAG